MPIQLHRLVSDQGVVAVHANEPQKGGPWPAVVFLHGAARTGKVLYHWANELEELADVYCIDLPGHGASELPKGKPTNLDTVAERVASIVQGPLSGRKVVLVGESVGGLIALKLAGMTGLTNIVGVLAADPPTSSRKLWHVQGNYLKLLAQRDELDGIVTFFEGIFGYDGLDIDGKVYYDVYRQVSRPAVILTGDFHLNPFQNANTVPMCLFDEVDVAVMEIIGNANLSIRELGNSNHLLLSDRVAEARTEILKLLKLCQVPA